MKYWRGYLIAAIIAVSTWALTQFAAAHTQLMDMVYPYMTRLVQTGLAQWSSGADFCLWQVLLLLAVAVVLASVVLMVVLRWNPIQWFGWVLTAVAIVNLLSTGLYGMNEYSGSIADDVRIESSDYTVSALEDAALYYLDQANQLSGKVSRNSSGQIEYAELSKLSEQAADGFESLTYEQLYPVFAGSMLPVKELGWSGYYSSQGITGVTVALTGEAAVNPQVPDVGLPFAICREMAHRMSIVKDGDANFAAFLACASNEDVDFQYSGYLLAFRFCYNSLAAVDTAAGRASMLRVENKLSAKVSSDMETYNEFFGKRADETSDETVNLLVNWHIRTVVIPGQENEEDKVVLFDPLDETDERLWDMIHPTEAP